MRRDSGPRNSTQSEQPQHAISMPSCLDLVVLKTGSGNLDDIRRNSGLGNSTRSEQQQQQQQQHLEAAEHVVTQHSENDN